jgi:hypothetical protein
VEQAARRTSASIILKQTLLVHQWMLSVLNQTNCLKHYREKL